MKKIPFGSLLLLVLLIPMLVYAPDVTEGARNGLLLWYHSVVPALFPFMVLSGLLSSGDGISRLMRPVSALFGPWLGLSSDGCFVLVAGLLCGYPLGAKLCAEFVADERIQKSEAQMLLAVCNHASPMFLLGYVYPFFSDHITMWELLICVYGPVFLIAELAKKIYMKQDKKLNGVHTPRNGKKLSLDEVILSSAETLCRIGGYLILFSVLIMLIRSVRLIPEEMKLFLIGAMEMTTGIRELAVLQNWKIGFTASIASLTFGGFSGIFQTKSVLKAGLSIRPYILWKLAHAALSAGLAYLICMCN